MWDVYDLGSVTVSLRLLNGNECPTGATYRSPRGNSSCYCAPPRGNWSCCCALRSCLVMAGFRVIPRGDYREEANWKNQVHQPKTIIGFDDESDY